MLNRAAKIRHSIYQTCANSQLDVCSLAISFLPEIHVRWYWIWLTPSSAFQYLKILKSLRRTASYFASDFSYASLVVRKISLRIRQLWGQKDHFLRLNFHNVFIVVQMKLFKPDFLKFEFSSSIIPTVPVIAYLTIKQLTRSLYAN